MSLNYEASILDQMANELDGEAEHIRARIMDGTFVSNQFAEDAHQCEVRAGVLRTASLKLREPSTP